MRAGLGPTSGGAPALLTGIAVLTATSYGVAVPEFYPTFQPWIGETVLRLMTWFTPGMAVAVLAAWARPNRGPTARRGGSSGPSRVPEARAG